MLHYFSFFDIMIVSINVKMGEELEKEKKMNSKKIRILSLVMAFLMVVTYLPLDTNAMSTDSNTSAEVTQELSKDESKEASEEVEGKEIKEEEASKEEAQVKEDEEEPKVEEPAKSLISKSDVSTDAGNGCITFYSTGTFSIAQSTYFATDGEIEYLRGNPSNEDNWIKWNGSSIYAAAYDGLYYLSLRGTGATYVSTSQKPTEVENLNPAAPLALYAGSGVDCVGDIESLLDYETVLDGEVPAQADSYIFTGLFKGFTKLTTAPSFITTSLENKDYAYAAMYYGCSSLIESPVLPAIKTGKSSYNAMFRNCTALEDFGDISANDFADSTCRQMFMGCTNLNPSGKEILITSMTGEATMQDMFRDCTSMEETVLVTTGEIGVYSFKTMYAGCSGLKVVTGLTGERIGSNGCRGMFYQCTSLTTVPDMTNTTTIDEYGCYLMFYGCTSLTKTPAIPAETISEHACEIMFYGCTKITEVGEISATTIKEAGCMQMFKDCKTAPMTTVPDLHCEVLEKQACYQMFYNCTVLAVAPLIPVVTAGEQACSQMFYADTGLTTVKDINAESVGVNAMSDMFRKCTKITTGPNISIQTVGDGGCNAMFAECTGITTAGSVTATTIGNSGFQGLYYKCTKLTSMAGINIETMGTNGLNIAFFGCTALTAAPAISTTIIPYQGLYQTFKQCSNMTSTPDLHCTEIGENGCYEMFRECKKLANSPAIPAITVGDHGCDLMFFQCYALTSSNLGTISTKTVGLSGFRSMFNSCTGLSSAPELQLETVGETGCSYMFANCTTLVTPMATLPALELGASCYEYMFQKCTKLTSMPSLPASTLATRCYKHMFEECKALVVTNLELPEDLVVAEGSFYATFSTCNSITSITVNFPDNTAKECYYGMFWACANLTTVDFSLNAEVIAETAYSNMFYQCKKLTNAPTMSFRHAGPTACYRMFYQCTALAEVPELPATELEGQCYLEMFYQCYSLTEGVKELPATELTTNCYKSMFYQCTGMQSAVTVLPATRLATGCYFNMFYGCTSLTTAPRILAKYIDETDACTAMYENCSSLTEVPDFVTLQITGSRACGHMFKGCTSLVKTPELPASRVSADKAYYEMFYNCTSLVEATNLPALQPSGTLVYGYMFYNCTKLTTVPDLPALSVSTQGYDCMFRLCTSLVTAPLLPATSIGDTAYSGMFYDCTSLENIPETLPAQTVPTNGYQYMFFNCTKLTHTPEIKAVTIGTNGCQYMFKGCTSLTDAEDFVCATVGQNALLECFNGCTSLVVAPALPANTLGQSCYQSAFANCTSLKYPADLPALNLTTACYNRLYQGCTSLVEAPQLRATSAANQCYYAMFDGCSSLVEPAVWKITNSATDSFAYMYRNCVLITYTPQIPNHAGQGSYQNMFEGCIALTDVSDLPALQIQKYSYKYMFANCKALVKGPDLPATNTSEQCYYAMFQGCTSLKTVPKVSMSTGNGKECMRGFVLDCTGIRIYNKPTANEYGIFNNPWRLNFSSASGSNWNKDAFTRCAATPANNPAANTTYYMLGGPAIGVGDGCVSFYSESPFQIRCSTSLQTNANLEFLQGDPTQDENWEAWETPTTKITAIAYRSSATATPYFYVSIRGKGGSYLRGVDGVGAIQFITDGQISSRGNMENLIDCMTVAAGGHPAMSSNAFAYAFANCISLANTPSLESTVLSEGCYSHMFENCTSLTEAAQLTTSELSARSCESMYAGCTSLTRTSTISATTIGYKSCDSMYKGCTSLVNWSDINATTLGEYAYANMFENCTKLTQTPNLPTTAVPSYAYSNMFKGCTSLNKIATVGATTVDSHGFDSMFSGCTALASSPNFLVTQIGEYGCANMFEGCTALTTTGSFPVTVVGANGCDSMYSGCTKLTTVPDFVFTTLGTGALKYMFAGCEALKNAPALPTEEVPESAYEGMFSGCIALTTPPELPALTVGSYAYKNMFKDCSSLQEIVTLPATTLSEGCYSNMFENCILIPYPTTLSATTLAPSCYKEMYKGCSGLRIYNKKVANSFGTFSKEWKVTAEEAPTDWSKDMFADCGASVDVTNNTNYYINAQGDIFAYADNVEVVYNGQRHTSQVVVEAPEEGYSISYSLDGTNFYASAFQFTSVSENTVYYKVEAPDYKDFIASYKVTILPAEMQVYAPDQFVEYSGEAQSPEINIIEPTANYTITYKTNEEDEYTEEKPSFTEEGAHKVFYRIENPNYNTYESSVTLTINSMKTVQASSSDVEFDYDGNPHSGEVNVQDPLDESAYTITYSEDGETYTEDKPVYSNAGIYTVYYKVNADSYNEYSGAFTVTINKALMTATSINDTFDYDGEEHGDAFIPEVQGPSEYKITYCGTSRYGVYKEEMPSIKNVGNYNIYYKVEASNYEIYQGLFQVSILPVDIFASASDVEVTYDGQPHKGKVTVTQPDEGYTIYYSDEEGVYDSTEELAYIEPDEYVVYYTVTAPNYNNFTGSYTITINPLEMEVTEEGAYVTYDGQPHKGTVEVTTPAEGYTIYYSEVKGRYLSTDEITYTEAGEYIVYYKVEAPGYDDYTGSFEVVIDPLEMDVTAEDATATFDGEEHTGEVVVTEPAEGYTIYYSETEGDYTSTSPVSFTETGSHTVYYKVTAPNYKDYEGNFKVVITGADMEVTADDVEVDYDGRMHTGEVVVSKPVDGYTIYYSENEENIDSIDEVTYLEVGEYTVYYKVVANGYNDFVGSFKVTINGLDIVASAEDITVKEDAQPHSGTVTVTQPTDEYTITYSTEEEGEYTETNPEYSAVGEYTVYYKVTAIGYNEFAGSFRIVIEQSAEMIESIPIYRMQNPNTTECVWTASKNEYDKVTNAGWKKQGIAFYCFKEEIDGAVPIYRMYNPNGNNGKGDHHYTKSVGEINKLVKVGWKKDFSGKPVFYAPSDGDITVYKLYDKGRTGCHVYTASETENNNLGKKGWVKEGIAWTSVKEGDTRPKSKKD